MFRHATAAMPHHKRLDGGGRDHETALGGRDARDGPDPIGRVRTYAPETVRLVMIDALPSPSGPAYVIEGDTLRIGGETIRLKGLDAPDLGQICEGARCGDAAKVWMQRRVDGRTVSCKGLERDQQKRLVATCRADGVDLGRQLIASGWAIAYRDYSADYVAAEQTARAERVGLWGLSYSAPVDYRQQRNRPRTLIIPGECNIKGDVNASGDRIYHRPGAHTFRPTRVDRSRGETWFCSEAEAEAAGFRPAD